MAANPQAMATSTKETEMAGPAPARPLSVAALPPFSNKSSTGALKTDLLRKCSPAAAVPVTVKIPDPITAPMPNATRLQTPSYFLSRLSSSSDEAISASMLFVRRSGFMRLGLALHLTFGHLPDLLLQGAARNACGALGLGRSFLAGSALQFLPFCFVGNVLGVHSS